jgi:hypothetical protein
LTRSDSSTPCSDRDRAKLRLALRERPSVRTRATQTSTYLSGSTCRFLRIFPKANLSVMGLFRSTSVYWYDIGEERQARGAQEEASREERPSFEKGKSTAYPCFPSPIFTRYRPFTYVCCHGLISSRISQDLDTRPLVARLLARMTTRLNRMTAERTARAERGKRLRETIFNGFESAEGLWRSMPSRPTSTSL